MKKVFVFIIIGMMVLVIAACSNKPKLTKALIDEINSVHNSLYDTDFPYTTYYGYFGKAHVFYLIGTDLIASSAFISSVEFKGTTDWTITLYFSQTFYDIFDYTILLELNIISQKDIENIAKIHNMQFA